MIVDLGTLLVLGAGILIVFSRQTAAVGAVVEAPGAYECFDQKEDNISVHCCRFKTKPIDEPHCKTSLIAGEYLKCCRIDKKPWGGLW